MVASLTEILEELKEVFTPTVAKAEYVNILNKNEKSKNKF